MIPIRIIIGLMLVVASIFNTSTVLAQGEKKDIRNGNNQYKNNQLADAELSYRKALEKNKDSEIAKFNLADALYKQGKYEEAIPQFQQLAESGTNKETTSQAYHNLGNAYLKTQKYQESVNAYKKSLKQNPNDEETRYNLAYAMSKLTQQQQQNQKDNKKDKDDKKGDDKKDGDKDKKDDKKDGDKKEDKKDGDNKDQKDSDGKDEDAKEKKPSKPDPKKISEGDAKRMLDALNQLEKNIQKRLSKKDAQQVEVEKNW